jgi:hypothetical protein
MVGDIDRIFIHSWIFGTWESVLNRLKDQLLRKNTDSYIHQSFNTNQPLSDQTPLIPIPKQENVEWVPNVELTVLKMDEVKRYQPYWKEDELWYDYLENVVARRNLVDIMFRIFNYMSQAGVSPDNCRTHFKPLRLDVNENLNIQSNHTLHNLTFPCIEISDIQWTNNETDISRLNRIVGEYQRSEVGAYNYYLSSGYVNQVQIVDMGDFPSWTSQKRKYIQEKFCNPSIMGTKDVNDPEGNALFYADEVQSTVRSLMTFFFPPFLAAAVRD